MENKRRTLLVPDKDADGLSSGVIVYRTLQALKLDTDLINVHLLSKGTTVHEESQRQLILEKRPERVIVLDQGSRSGPRLVDSAETRCLVIDHHNATDKDFPDEAEVVGSATSRVGNSDDGSLSPPAIIPQSLRLLSLRTSFVNHCIQMWLPNAVIFVQLEHTVIWAQR